MAETWNLLLEPTRNNGSKGQRGLLQFVVWVGAAESSIWDRLDFTRSSNGMGKMSAA